ncbi:MAG: hypothetical protein V2A73_06325 [Pseudomonadota bacterium]
MKKSGSILAMVAAATFGLAACSDGGDDPPDAQPIDAAIDAPPTGKVQPYGECISTDECAPAEPQTSCVPIGWLKDKAGNMPKACLYECKASTECPFGNVCYPAGGGSLGTAFSLMAGHCYVSYCGFGNAQNPGATGQPCNLGEELGLDAANQFPGWCLPLADGIQGLCIEVGTKTVGDACDFQNRKRGGSNCDATSICVGATGAVTGKCAKLCDPNTILTRESGNSDCPLKEDCADQSSVDTYDRTATPPVVYTQTIGFCSPDVTACALFAENTCPDNSKGEKQACASSNPVRATGACQESAYGNVALDGTCARPTQSAPNVPEDKECAAGNFCWSVDEQGTSFVCRKLCDTGSPTCPDNTTCQAVMWDSGQDSSSIKDDNYTIGWGMCLPPKQ